MMDASEVHEEVKEKKKIHFAVPSTAPTQLDPRQVEMIRRRRPTPATLFRVADQPCPEDDYSTGQWAVGENGVLRPKRLNPNVYQPPSLKDSQTESSQDQSKPLTTDRTEEEEEEEEEQEEEEDEEKVEEEETAVEGKHGATDG
ncbi:protein phosphatase 1 regulatory subunit 1B isoform X2 [Silurus meridionalis]|uniref:protein phosphatase 1 regulatory subunit 1B isoform X2 n=1 Tax=Silurus meridionalis TaxID=175797 RepID=UPI001EEC5E33|nr:protein phosphatase 1 regulatory subunit 1B isoform X2 [Silurus meridionalis]